MTQHSAGFLCFATVKLGIIPQKKQEKKGFTTESLNFVRQSVYKYGKTEKENPQ